MPVVLNNEHIVLIRCSVGILKLAVVALCIAVKAACNAVEESATPVGSAPKSNRFNSPAENSHVEPVQFRLPVDNVGKT